MEHITHPEAAPTEREITSIAGMPLEAVMQTEKDDSAHLIDSSRDMIVAVDLRRHIVEFNHAAEQTFGYTKAEVLGSVRTRTTNSVCAY